MTGIQCIPAQGSSPNIRAGHALNMQIHGLRGFSAFGVFICHIYGMSLLWNFWPPALEPVKAVFHAGAYGVEIFFVISGYLITASLIRHQSAGKFLVDRCIRIYPVFLTIHMLVFSIGPFVGYKWMAGISAGKWLGAFISNALFLPGLFPFPIAQLNAWSLSYEAAFYLVSALTFIAARAAGRRNAGIGLAIVLLPLLFIYTTAAFFLVGVAIFFLTERSKRTVPVFFRMLSVPALIAVPVLLTLSDNGRLLIVVSLLPAFIFFWSIVEGRCALSWFLRRRWLQYLGTISYSFYLWSPVVTYPMKILVGRVLQGRVNAVLLLFVFFVVALVVALAVSHLSYRVLEDRVGRMLRSRAHRERQSLTQGAGQMRKVELGGPG